MKEERGFLFAYLSQNLLHYSTAFFEVPLGRLQCCTFEKSSVVLVCVVVLQIRISPLRYYFLWSTTWSSTKIIDRAMTFVRAASLNSPSHHVTPVEQNKWPSSEIHNVPDPRREITEPTEMFAAVSHVLLLGSSVDTPFGQLKRPDHVIYAIPGWSTGTSRCRRVFVLFRRRRREESVLP